MGLLSDIDAPARKLEIIKSLLSDTVSSQEFFELLQKTIEEMSQEESIEPEDETIKTVREPSPSVGNKKEPEDKSIEDELGLEKEKEEELPNPVDLDIDLADNTAIQNELGEE